MAASPGHRGGQRASGLVGGDRLGVALRDAAGALRDAGGALRRSAEICPDPVLRTPCPGLAQRRSGQVGNRQEPRNSGGCPDSVSRSRAGFPGTGMGFPGVRSGFPPRETARARQRSRGADLSATRQSSGDAEPASCGGQASPRRCRRGLGCARGVPSGGRSGEPAVGRDVVGAGRSTGATTSVSGPARRGGAATAARYGSSPTGAGGSDGAERHRHPGRLLPHPAHPAWGPCANRSPRALRTRA